MERGEIQCIYIFRPDVQTKYRLPIFDVTLSLREKFSRFFWQQKSGAPGSQSRTPEKNWLQVEKIGAAVGCVYICGPDVHTKYRPLIFRRHFPLLISARTIFAKSLKDPATNQKIPEKLVVGREILGCCLCVYIPRPDVRTIYRHLFLQSEYSSGVGQKHF